MSAGCVVRVTPHNAQSEEATLANRLATYDDGRLTEYLATIVARLAPDGVAAAPVTVIDDPTLAAFVMPSGRVYVHTGLLSRVGNEAELALIVARELAHHTLGHARQAGRGFLADARGRKRALPHHDLSPTAAAILGLELPVAETAAMRGYGAERERQADAEALRRLTAAGYDGEQALLVFERLAAQGVDRGPLEMFVYGNRRRMGERYESLRQLLAAGGTRPGSGDVGDRRAFEDRMRPVVRDTAALDLRADRFGLAQAQLERVLADTPRDPIAWVLHGDLARLRAQRAPAGAERVAHARDALASYRRALELDPSYVDPVRQLGLLFYQERDVANARAAFERYLAAAPTAADAGRIREYLAVLREVKP
jgi:predicted Zn-dependent protease